MENSHVLRFSTELKRVNSHQTSVTGCSPNNLLKDLRLADEQAKQTGETKLKVGIQRNAE